MPRPPQELGRVEWRGADTFFACRALIAGVAAKCLVGSGVSPDWFAGKSEVVVEYDDCGKHLRRCARHFSAPADGLAERAPDE
jgi:hypothetical protein